MTTLLLLAVFAGGPPTTEVDMPDGSPETPAANGSATAAFPAPQPSSRRATVDRVKTDLLVVVAHPDDESTFGGLLPEYTICRGKRVEFICLTSGEWGNGLPHHETVEDPPDYSYDDSDEPRFAGVPVDALYPCYYREGELTAVLRSSGVSTPPTLPRFRDMTNLGAWNTPDPAFELWGGRERVVGYLVAQIRRCRPDVVVTMAVDGYNGNPLHMAASRGTVLACEAAGHAPTGDSSQVTSSQVTSSKGDSTQAAADGRTASPWTPAKVYVAVTQGSDRDQVTPTAADRLRVVHPHSWGLSCGDGRPTAREVAADANALHLSQQMPRECPAATDFVLVQTAVGPDRVGRNDLFENVDRRRNRSVSSPPDRENAERENADRQ